MNESPVFTMDTLRALMRTCVGVEEDLDINGPIEDVPFADLGYDSLARLELTGQLRRQYGIDVPEDVMSEQTTPAAVVAHVRGTTSAVL